MSAFRPVRIVMELAPDSAVEWSDPMPYWLAREVLVMWIPSVNVRWHPADRQFGVGSTGGFEIRSAMIVDLPDAQEQAA